MYRSLKTSHFLSGSIISWLIFRVLLNRGFFYDFRRLLRGIIVRAKVEVVVRTTCTLIPSRELKSARNV